MEIAVLIPAYQPDSVLISLVQALHRENFRLIVTDDGSGPAYADIFSALLPYAEVLTAPRTGARATHSNVPCAIWLRTRRAAAHSSPQMPTASTLWRTFCACVRHCCPAAASCSPPGRCTGKASRSARAWATARFFFSLAAGCFLEDNQSGLRGFSTDCLPWLTEIGGEKYDYEMNVLLYAARQELPITQLPIETVYLDGNQSSHFDPLRDTLRIYRRMLWRGCCIRPPCCSCR